MVLNRYILFVIALLSLSCNDSNESAGKVEKPTQNNNEQYIKTLSFIDEFGESIEVNLLNQHNEEVKIGDFQNKKYLVHTFFTSCPSICVPLIKNMKEVHKILEGKGITIYSISVDFKTDSVPRIKKFIEKKNIDDKYWQMLSGSKDDLYTLSSKLFTLLAREEEGAPGGFSHTADVLLIDERNRVRGIYNGTSKKEIDQLIKDLDSF